MVVEVGLEGVVGSVPLQRRRCLYLTNSGVKQTCNYSTISAPQATTVTAQAPWSVDGAAVQSVCHAEPRTSEFGSARGG